MRGTVPFLDDALDGEIGYIEKLDVEFQTDTPVSEDPSLETLRKDYDAVLVTIGSVQVGRWAEIMQQFFLLGALVDATRQIVVA